MTKIKYLLTSALLMLGLVTAATPAGAISLPAMQTSHVAKAWTACDNYLFGLPPWFRYLEMTDGCAPMIKSINHVWVIALNIVDMLIRLAGLIAVGFIIWGGFKYMKSQGDPGKIAESRTVILNSVIGLIVVISAVAIVQMIAGSLA